ncbi:MAG: IS110 family transposase [Burkholderiaceae bacterium]|nr:IS110 family transposase [Burkholderiaceae bacterium]
MSQEASSLERRRAMREYIAFDAHKHYTWAERETVESRRRRQCRIEHGPGAIRQYLADAEPGTAVAVEATGNWYWIVDEIEAAGCRPALVHAYKAKVMLGCVNKTDQLDARGLNRLQRTGTLPTVWIPPAPLRDQRDLPRTRMFLVQQRTRLKCRIQAHLTKYGLNVRGFSDSFGVGARKVMERNVAQLPPFTQAMTRELLRQYDFVDAQVQQAEERMERLLEVTPAMQRLMTLPGVGRILSAVMALEVGEVGRFATAGHLASYAGTTPRVHSSGDRTRYGRLRQDVNRYLKWAFIEAANCVCLSRRHHPDRHVSRLYERVARRKGHKKAIGAVARHLAEAAFYVLSKQEDYREPEAKTVRSTGA